MALDVDIGQETVHGGAAELDRAHLDKISDSVVLDRSRLWRAEDSNIRCPLCLGKFEKMYDGARRIFIYACHTDKIAIACGDPFVGKWAGAMKDETMPCPACNADMRFFCTSTGFMKAKCPKKGCGATLGTAQPDRKPGVTTIPGAGANTGIDRPVLGPEIIQ